MMLFEGTDYLYFAHAYHSGGAITGVYNSEVCVVATRRYLFIIPERTVTLGKNWIKTRKHWFQSDDGELTVQQAVERFLANPALTIDELEIALRDLIGPGDYVVALEGLSKLTVWSKFMRQIRFKRRDRGTTQVLALQGKGNHERFKTFFADSLTS
jgi:hypothetical protein